MKNKVLKYLIEVVILIIGVLIAFYLTKYGEKLNKDRNEHTMKYEFW